MSGGGVPHYVQLKTFKGVKLATYAEEHKTARIGFLLMGSSQGLTTVNRRAIAPYAPNICPPSTLTV